MPVRNGGKPRAHSLTQDRGEHSNTTNIPSGGTQDMGLMPTHRRRSQTCSPTSPCATCWAVGVQRSQAGLSPRDGWPWSALCTGCPGRKAGGEGRKGCPPSATPGQLAFFLCPPPCPTPSHHLPHSTAVAPLLLFFPAKRLQPLPDTHSSLYADTHLPQNSST